jgi:hypothetical protein
LVITGMDLPGQEQGQVRSLHRPPVARVSATSAAWRRAGVRRGRRASWRLRERPSPGAGMHEVQRERLVARSDA